MLAAALEAHGEMKPKDREVQTALDCVKWMRTEPAPHRAVRELKSAGIDGVKDGSCLDLVECFCAAWGGYRMSPRVFLLMIGYHRVGYDRLLHKHGDVAHGNRFTLLQSMLMLGASPSLIVSWFKAWPNLVGNNRTTAENLGNELLAFVRGDFSAPTFSTVAYDLVRADKLVCSSLFNANRLTRQIPALLEGLKENQTFVDFDAIGFDNAYEAQKSARAWAVTLRC